MARVSRIAHELYAARAATVGSIDRQLLAPVILSQHEPETVTDDSQPVGPASDAVTQNRPEHDQRKATHIARSPQ
jgi:ClpP class serine protease